MAASVAGEAGRLLLGIRHLGGREGDRRSNELILSRLAAERPGDAVLSEESADSRARLGADRVWIVDPLDGTREYGMEGRSDWAVHIALWERGSGITAAAVAQPALGQVYATDTPPPSAHPPARRLLVSDSRPPRFARAAAEAIGAEQQSMGSAGAKAMAVLRGEALAYVHAGGQYEWDSAAPVGVVRAGGLHASRLDGSPLEYNQMPPYLPDLVICWPEVADPLLAALSGLA